MRSIYINVRSVHIRIGCQILPIVKGNDKNAIVDTLISSNNDMAPDNDAPIAYKHAFSSSLSSIVKWRSSVQRGPAAVTIC